jgi:vacuolar iron transporter family protein
VRQVAVLRPGWGGDVRRAVLRVVLGGALGLAFTHGVGRLFGTAVH